MEQYQKFLVTGASGVIGSRLVERLYGSGKKIKVLTRNKPNVEKLLNFDIDLHIGDLEDPVTLKNISKDIEVVIHCAGIGNVSAISKKDYETFYKVNVEGTLNLAKECSQKNVKKFIHLSSTAAMGLIRDIVSTEKTPCNPKTPYQKSKYLSEQKLLEMSGKFDLPVVVLRPSMVYGPFAGGELLRWCRTLKKGLFPRVGFGKNLTPMIYIDDLMNGIVAAIQMGKPKETYLLCSNQSYEMNEIIDIITTELKIKFVPTVPKSILLASAFIIENLSRIFGFEPFVTTRNILSLSSNRLFDITKAKSDLGFNPSYTIGQGIRESISYYLNNDLL
jgi:nucleoside-diphosphate-sugar epimerase